MVLVPNAEERAEKGRAQAHTPGERFAYWLSQLTSPFVVGFVTLGGVALATASHVGSGLVWLAMIGAGLLIPFVFVWWGVRRGHFSDIHVSRRSQRLFPLLVGLLCIGGMLAGLLLLGSPRALVTTLVAVLVSFAIATGITQLGYKISFHIGSAAGAVTVCCLLASPIFVVLSPVVVLIAWARWKLEAHSPLQAMCGATLAVAVTLTTFWLSGLL